MESNILKDIIKGDELRIASILEKYNSCDGLVKQISQAIGTLETHCVQYGLSIEEKKEYKELQAKYYELEARYEYTKKANRRNTREVYNLRNEVKRLRE